MLGCISCGGWIFFLGQFLDKKLDITPWGSIMGLFLGLAAAFRSIYQKIHKLQEWMREKNLENKKQQ